MTASTPRSLSNAPPVLTMNLSGLSGSFFLDKDQHEHEGGRASLAPRNHSNRRPLKASTTMPPCLPSPGTNSTSSSRATAQRPACNIDAFPALPVLEPRAKTGAATLAKTASLPNRSSNDQQEQKQPCLMDFVSHMSSLSCDTTTKNDDAIFSSSNSAIMRRPSISEVAESTMELAQDVLDHMDTSTSATASTNSGSNKKGHRVRAPSFHQLQPQISAPSDWTWETPETTKTMLTATPLAVRMRGHQSSCSKRKSPVLPVVVHQTPVGGNRPLMLPSLNSSNSLTATRSCRTNQLQRGRTAIVARANNMSQTTLSTPCQQQQHYNGSQQRQCKRAKNHAYTKLLNNAPMLPSSPDLEDRPLVSRNVFQTPLFSPQVASRSPPLLYVTRSNPMDDDAALSDALPSLETMLDDTTSEQEQRSATGLPIKNNWLRMKRRQSLVCALRLAATSS